MANFNYTQEVEENVARLKSREQMLGKGLNIPFNASNSGSRKVMDNVHQDHALVLSKGEVPYIGTGYENIFGDYSSSIIQSDRVWTVIAKIPKFSNIPNHHYFLIVADINNQLHVIERRSYHYSTEIYGYMINNTALDAVAYPNKVIHQGDILVRSAGFDQYGNKTNGTNLNVVYLSMDDNMEDSVIISDVCAEKMKSPLFYKVKRVLNENDILLYLYGDKLFPDIGEDIKDGILFAYRREDKENAIYTQAETRLHQVMMSDEKARVKHGKVIDLDIYCNNPEVLSSNISNAQLNKYYMDRVRFNRDVVSIVSGFVNSGYTLSYDLQKLYFNCKEELEGKQFIDKRKFSFLTLEFVIMDEVPLEIGDKVADRYGGKGVVSKKVPQKLMPMLPNGEYADMIKNSSTMYGRENAGQVFELSENYVSMCILDHIRQSHMEPADALELILRFLRIVSPKEAEEMEKYTKSLKQDEFSLFMMSQLESDCIYVSAEPISDRIDIDLIGQLYEEFPWITQQKMQVPIKDSNGNYRYIDTRRGMVMAKQYILRLKQVADEKFSATSLSATNIKNENAKSKDSKNYKEMYSNTPIRFGPMESGDMEHMGSDIVVINMMLYSTSPHGRRLAEELYTGDPYDVDIRLNSKAKNRSVEQLNAKLKTMGHRIVFTKRRKIKKPVFTIPAVEFMDYPNGCVPAIEFMGEGYDFEGYYKWKREYDEEAKRHPVLISAVSFFDDGEEHQDDNGEG